MKKTILTLCSAITALCLSGYDIAYTYDAAGNRIRRGPYTEVVQQAMRSVPDRVGTESMLGDVRVMYSPNPTKGM